MHLKRKIASMFPRRNHAAAPDRKAVRLERAIKSRSDIDKRVAKALLSVPRDAFVPAEHRQRAYEDRALPIGEGQTISQPSLVAHMISELDISDRSAKILDVGCGSGYQAACLSKLADQIISVERVASLTDSARELLDTLQFRNVEVVMALEDVLGYPPAAPYDGIIVGAGVPKIPSSLVAQLKPGARMVLPVGDRRRQRLATVTRTIDGIKIRRGVACAFVPLIGPEAW